MKKRKIVTLIFFILYFISCENINLKRSTTYQIIQFDKPIYDTLTPLEGKYYGAKTIEIKGYVNDTIIISFGKGYDLHYLTKKIDTIIKADYYGNEKASFIFKPYKGKNGNIELKFRI